MKSLSSIDVHYLSLELKALQGARIDNIYQKGKEEFLFQFHQSSVGKKLLRLLVGKMIYLASFKEEMESVSGFCSLLRKHLDGVFLREVSQVQPERILKLTFQSKEKELHLYLEFFGKGNIILTDQNRTILDALVHHQFKDRKVGPKEKYLWPTMQYDLFSLDKDYLKSLLLSSNKESIVKALAIELGLGGIYAEEACNNCGIEKSLKPSELTEDQSSSLLSSLKDLTAQKIKPIIYLKEGAVSDVYPIPLKTFEDKESKNFPTYSEALEHYCAHFSPDLKTSYDSKIDELTRIIEAQQENILSLEREEREQREKAEMIYSNYLQIKSIIDELKEVSKKHSWQKIKETLKDHQVIKDVNPKDKSIVIEL